MNKYGCISKNGLSPQSIALIVKSVMKNYGVDIKNISGHSLRSGYCTSAAKEGIPLWIIKLQTGHKSDVTLMKYIRNYEASVGGSIL